MCSHNLFENNHFFNLQTIYSNYPEIQLKCIKTDFQAEILVFKDLNRPIFRLLLIVLFRSGSKRYCNDFKLKHFS